MKKTLVLVFVLALFTLIGLIVPLFGKIFTPENPYRAAQEELANKLGVKIEDYPGEKVFPEGYFLMVLKPGMTSVEIHNVIQGYEKALHCKTYSEIYFYFATDDANALRFEIRYDEQGRFRELQGEDEDSRTIWPEGCEAGLIEE